MEYVYAAMLLHSAGKEINEEAMHAVLNAAGIKPDESQIKAVISALKGVDIDKVISEAQVASVAQAPQAQAQAENKKESAPKEEKKAPEEAAAGLSSLFG